MSNHQENHILKRYNSKSNFELLSKMRLRIKEKNRLGKIEAKSGGPPNFIAGEMSATEQSRRTASRILERMTSVPMESPSWQRCNDALVSELGFITAQDSWFLEVTPPILESNPVRNMDLFWDQAWLRGVCGNLTGEKNGVACTKVL